MIRPFPAILPGLLLVPCLASAARAESAPFACAKLERCAQIVSELTGDRYVYDADAARGAFSATANFELTKENAEEVFTLMLDRSGYTRLALSAPRSYAILRQRDARDSALPTVLADAKSAPELPKTWDLASLRYKLANGRLAEHICRTIRSFLPANSRVVPDENSGQIFVVAAYPILASALRTIQSMDVKGFGAPPRAPIPRQTPRAVVPPPGSE